MSAAAATPWSVRKTVNFWSFLSLTWLCMSFELPTLNSFAGRMSDATENLAAFGVAHSLVMLIESPIIMLLSLSAALVDGQRSLKFLTRFSVVLCVSVSVLLAVALIGPLFDLLTLSVLGLPPRVAALVHTATLIMLPVPFCVGFRRFYQGLLILAQQAPLVAAGTVGRLLIMVVVALLLFIGPDLSGSALAATAITVGISFEAYYAWALARPTVRRLAQVADRSAPLTLQSVARFYFPLTLATLMNMAVGPVVTLFVARAPHPVESLAVLSVSQSLLFLFNSFPIAYQEVIISALRQSRENFQTLKLVQRRGGIAITACLTLIAFSPLASVVFEKIFNLPPELVELGSGCLQFLAPYPLCTMLLVWNRGLLVYSSQTRPSSTATAIELGIIILWMSIVPAVTGTPGALAAAMSYTIARLASGLYLRRAVKKTGAFP